MSAATDGPARQEQRDDDYLGELRKGDEHEDEEPEDDDEAANADVESGMYDDGMEED